MKIIKEHQKRIKALATVTEIPADDLLLFIIGSYLSTDYLSIEDRKVVYNLLVKGVTLELEAARERDH